MLGQVMLQKSNIFQKKKKKKHIQTQVKMEQGVRYQE